MSSNTEKVVNGVSIQTIVTVLLGVIEMGYFAIMSRLLTKSDFGYYAALTGVMTIFMSISEAGLGASIIQKKDASDKFISTAFMLSILLGSTISIVVFLGAPYLATLIVDETLCLPLRAMAITVLPYCLTSVGNALLYKKLDFKHIGINSVVTYFLSSIVAICCALKGMGLYSVLIYSVMVPLLNFALLYVFYVKFPKPSLCRQHVKEIFSFGGWLTLSTLVNNITHQIDKLVLPKLMSIQDLGAYNRPAGFTTTISSKINSIFDTVLFPMLSGFQDDRSKIKSILFRSVILLNSLSIIFAAIFFLNAETIIRIFFGAEWLDLVPVLQILSISLIFNIDNRLVDCFFRSLGMVKQSFYLRIMGFVFTLGSIVVTSKFGLSAVAFGIVAANVLTIYIKMMFLCKRIDVNIPKLVIKWIASWKSSIPLVVLWCIFLFIPSGLITTFVFIFLQCAVLLVQFVLVPRSVSTEYETSVYPIIRKMIK